MIKIGLLGDVALTEIYDLSLNKNAKTLFNEVVEYLNGLDLVIANLESPLTNKSSSLVCKAIHLKGDPQGVEILKLLNIGMVSLANNHLFDYGRKGAEDTVKILDENNIKHFGYKNNSNYIDVKNERLNFHGFCCYSANASGYGVGNGVIPLHKRKVTDVLKGHTEGLNILSIHWGDENNHYPRFEFVEFIKELANSHDFVLHGHHPHVLQGFQRFNNSHIGYSLGNFCFSDLVSIFSKDIKVTQNEQNKTSVIWELSIEDSKVVDSRLVPTKILSDGHIKVLNGKEKEIVLNNIRSYSDALTFEENEYNLIRKKSYTKELDDNRYKMSWVLARLNYYFLGAYIKGKFNRKKYSKYFIN